LTYAAEVKRKDTFRFLQALRLQRKVGASLVTADSPWSPTIGLLLGTVLPDTCAVAVWEGRRAVALAHLARQSGREQWEIKHLVIAGMEASTLALSAVASARLLRLLDEVCRLAGAKRMSGIVTRIAEDSRLVETFYRAGFTSMMQEFTFTRSSPFGAEAPEVPGLRLQEKRDAWPLHQLYLRSTPQVVRLSEGRTVRDWQLRRSSSRFSFQVTRWVVEGQCGLTGWLAETPEQSGALRVQIGVAPREHGLARKLVAVALDHANASGSAAVWSRVPAHATDVRQALETCGFAATGSDLVIKRSLAIRVRDVAPARETKRKVARSGLTVTQSRALEAQHLGSGAPEAAQVSRLR
jgi:hypothetical protein